MNGDCANHSYKHRDFNAKEIDRMTAKQTGDVGLECYVLLIWKPVLEVELKTPFNGRNVLKKIWTICKQVSFFTDVERCVSLSKLFPLRV